MRWRESEAKEKKRERRWERATSPPTAPPPPSATSLSPSSPSSFSAFLVAVRPAPFQSEPFHRHRLHLLVRCQLERFFVFFVKIWEAAGARGTSLSAAETAAVCWGAGREGESSTAGSKAAARTGWGTSSPGGEWVFFGFEITGNQRTPWVWPIWLCKQKLGRP